MNTYVHFFIVCESNFSFWACSGSRVRPCPLGAGIKVQGPFMSKLVSCNVSEGEEGWESKHDSEILVLLEWCRTVAE